MTDSILEEMARRRGDPQRALAAKLRGDQDVLYAFDHMEEWRREHPDKWIAVYNKKLVGAEASIEALRATLAKKNISLSDDIFMTFLYKEKVHLIFHHQ